MKGFALVVVWVCVFAVLSGRAYSYEVARLGGGLSERGELPEAPHGYTAVGLQGAVPSPRSESSSQASGRVPVSAPSLTAGGTARPEPFSSVGRRASLREDRYQGKTAYWWAKRAVQARKDANARARTIRRLQSAQLSRSQHFFAWLRGAECVHNEEGAWTAATGNGYYGGMQADRSFQRAYGPSYYRLWGTANRWPMWAQLHMAYHGWLVRGWQPWPNTARECGLR